MDLIHFMTDTTFSALGLDDRLLQALHAENYETPTPIQAQSIPLLLDGRDLLGIAQTGTGKTAAFVLPILQGIAKAPRKATEKSPQALILAPTRELAIQIGDAVATYGQNLRFRHAVIFGGVGQNPQIEKMKRGVHVLVATPGRLLDLINQGHIDLGSVETFVLDEADRMLDMGFIHDMRKVVAMLPEERQSLLLSATMPGDIARLAKKLLRDPATVEISPKELTVDRIEQRVYFPEKTDKPALLAEILKDESLYRVIVFSRTKHGANRVAQFLNKKNVPTEAIHGNKSQGARQRALESFRNGDTRVLIATDIAARGIDIDDVTHVINYELPNEPESYVHRIGRTARAGADGIAISFCSEDERPYLRDIEKLIRRSITDAEERPHLAHIPKKPKLAARGQQQKRNGSSSRRNAGVKSAGRPGGRPGGTSNGKPKRTGGKPGTPANANARNEGGQKKVQADGAKNRRSRPRRNNRGKSGPRAA